MGFAIYFKLGMTAGNYPAIQKAGPEGTIVTAAGNSEECPGREQGPPDGSWDARRACSLLMDSSPARVMAVIPRGVIGR